MIGDSYLLGDKSKTMERIENFNEKVLETNQLSLVRIKAETHGADLNQIICDTFDTLEPWMAWCKKKPTVAVYYLKIEISFSFHH